MGEVSSVSIGWPFVQWQCSPLVHPLFSPCFPLFSLVFPCFPLFSPALNIVTALCFRCATTSFKASDIERYTNTFVNLHTFFQHYGWSSSWESGQTIRCWCDTWASVYTALRNDNNSATSSSFLLDAEIPSLEDMLVTLSLFTHFLLPLAVPLVSGIFVLWPTTFVLFKVHIDSLKCFHCSGTTVRTRI